ncbi:MAG: hypothetical protein IPM25_15455 [Chloracidobacterium sp.]|nr:hypothetical protein [Chloracidobacterium sp.]
MPRCRILVLAAVSIAVLLGASRAAPGQITQDVFRRTLTDKAGVTAADLERLSAGEAVVAAIETNDKQEVAVIGVVRIAPKRPLSIEDLRSSLSPRQNTEVGAGEKFSTPPRIEDLSEVRLTDDDVEELLKCELGNCDLNLSESSIRRIREAASQGDGQIKDKLTQVFAQILFEHLLAYQKAGDSALGDYANRGRKVRLSDAHAKLFRETLFLSKAAPPLNEALARFPAGDQAAVASEFFWSTVDFGLKPMITLSHLSYYPSGPEPSDVLAVATKQIYASRYLDASLTLALIVPVEDGEKKETFLIFTDRSRSDALEGMFGSFTRRVVKTEAVKRVTDIVATAKTRLEQTDRPAATVTPEPAADTMLSRAIGWISTPLGIAAVAAAILLLGFILFRRKGVR